MLTGGARDLPTRHQTLRNTLEWSYDLLNQDEKILYARLGVFVGGFTFEAAEARTAHMLAFARQNDLAFGYVSSFITLAPHRVTLFSRFKRRTSPYYVLKQRLESMVLRAMARGQPGLVVNPAAWSKWRRIASPSTVAERKSGPE